jgi:hypothetical protein
MLANDVKDEKKSALLLTVVLQRITRHYKVIPRNRILLLIESVN